MTERETCPVCGNPDAESERCVDDIYGDYYRAHCGKCGWEYDGLESMIADSDANPCLGCGGVRKQLVGCEHCGCR